jgi:geranylgeranyl diphosphate synthase type II
MTPPDEFIAEVRSRIDEALLALEKHTIPGRLYEPVRYVLSGRGKRFRPLLVYSASDMFDGDPDVTRSAALAVEVFHAFTLVHDDIMDESEQRRGRDTVHTRWDVPTAILCGDYLQGLSADLLRAFPVDRTARALELYGRTVRDLCEGQILDMEFETRSDVDLDDYLDMIDRKTAALIRLSLQLGALTGSATGDDLHLLERISEHLGRAFQIRDDYLDLMAEDGQWGKPVGGDLVAGKKSFLSLMAAKRAGGADAELVSRLLTPGGFTFDDVPGVRAAMDRMGVLDEARSTVIFHSDQARELLGRLPETTGRRVLAELTDRMQTRYH